MSLRGEAAFYQSDYASTVKLCDKERLGSEEPGNSEPFSATDNCIVGS